MFNRKQAKQNAKLTVKRNYLVLVFSCLLLAFFGLAHADSLIMLDVGSLDEEASQTAKSDQSNIVYEFLTGNIGIKIDGENLIPDDILNAQKRFDENKSKSISLGSLEISYADGEFAKIANMFATGSYITTLYNGIDRLTGSSTAAIVIVILLSMALRLAMTCFVLNVFAVVFSRIFLEARTYDRIHFKSFFFLLHTKKWLHTAVVLIVKEVYLLLWGLTIVGGVIKRFSYFLVPYIIAENPQLSAKEAITLSRKMMDGHKFECFKMQVSFLGWLIFGALTFGLGAVFFVNPYIDATYAEFYASLREQAKEKALENADELNDEFLFRKASSDELTHAYPDIEQLIAETESFTDSYTGARAFFANVFGIVPAYSERTEAIDRNEVNKIKVSQFRDEVDGAVYPTRLSPIPTAPKRDRLSTLFYTRSYSVTSLVMMFFTGCMIGWIWEFIYKYIEVGEFVNRGVLHGPWLPIYGSGAVMILIVLKKFRKNALAEFFAAVVLCGIVEYFTAYILETTHGGQKWWDYSGYFLNINGRVCAEGLMVFGIGGVAFVYFGAPMLDNLIRKIKHHTAVIICTVLSVIFVADVIYSHYYPNQGKGITDYETAQTVSQAQE